MKKIVCDSFAQLAEQTEKSALRANGVECGRRWTPSIDEMNRLKDWFLESHGRPCMWHAGLHMQLKQAYAAIILGKPFVDTQAADELWQAILRDAPELNFNRLRLLFLDRLDSAEFFQGFVAGALTRDIEIRHLLDQDQ